MVTRHQYDTIKTILAVGGSRPLTLTMGRTTSYGGWRPGRRAPGALRTSTVRELAARGLVEWVDPLSGRIIRRAPGPIRELVLFATAAGCKAVHEYECAAIDD